MQLDREYLFIEEVESHYGFTKFDLIDYLNQERLQLYAWVSLSSIYGVCELQNNEKDSIVGCFDYKGIIKVSNDLTLLIQDKTEKLEVYNVELIEDESIQNWRDKKPNTFSYPNKDFVNYKFIANYRDLDIRPFIGGLDSFDRQTYAFEEIHSPESLVKRDFSNDEYTKHNLIIKPTNLRVKKSEIEDVIYQNSKRFNKHKLTDALTEKRVAPIDELIKRIIRHGISSGSEVFQIIKREANTDEDDRLFDTYKILIEANENRIICLDIKGNEDNPTRKTILNKVSGFKKSIQR